MEHGAGNVSIDSENYVGHGVDRGCVDIVDDDWEMLVQETKQSQHYSTCNQNTK